jgi:hypothetical protein
MKPSIKLTKDAKHSYKIGLDEVVGLESVLRKILEPVRAHLNDLDNWSGDNWFQFETVEYKSRDGFIAHSHNCGGIEIRAIVPKCGEYNFDFLEFGEYEEQEKGQSDEDYDRQRDIEEYEGHLDAQLRVWLKFEGIEDGTLKFYLYAGGGNGDAPYFRTKYETDLFEASFEVKSLAGIQRAASKHVKALIKAFGGKAVSRE